MRLALAASLASLSSYCLSDPYSYGTTNNAALGDAVWDMSNVLPNVAGVEVNGLFYRYTVNKNTTDDMKVTYGNEGVFSRTDDWSGLPSSTLTKALRFDNIPASAWGNGYIEVEGDGEVTDPVFVYSYRVDECSDPQLNPACDGYIQKVDIPVLPDLYDASDDEAVRLATQETDLSKVDDAEAEDEEDKPKKKSRLELGLSAGKNALAMGIDQAAMLDAINSMTNMAMYYSLQINGGQYEDAPMLVDADLPENKRALRNNLAQQVLHDKMVQQQYEDQ